MTVKDIARRLYDATRLSPPRVLNLDLYLLVAFGLSPNR
jgi:hypothetical protein